MEPRWPLALVLGGFIAITIVLNILVPDRARFGPRGVVPAIEVGLLLALLAADPTAIARRTRWLRPLAITLISTLLVVVVAADAKLITDIIRGAKVTQSAAGLLASGAILWLGTAVSFGLFYWELDAVGPLARFRGTHPYPDFAFSQQLSPELAPPNWHATYVDYLILGLTTSTAFSPTDVMPMTAWAKLTMALQSIVSLSVVGLVIARAVNVFS